MIKPVVCLTNVGVNRLFALLIRPLILLIKSVVRRPVSDVRRGPERRLPAVPINALVWLVVLSSRSSARCVRTDSMFWKVCGFSSEVMALRSEVSVPMRPLRSVALSANSKGASATTASELAVGEAKAKGARTRRGTKLKKRMLADWLV